MRTLLGTVSVLFVGFLLLSPSGGAEQPVLKGVPPRTPWNTSRIKGSPEPPHPYVLERAFPRLSFRNPVFMARLPQEDRFFIGEQAGRILSFPNVESVAQADLFFDLSKELSSWDRTKVKGVGALYGLAFHPRFDQNGYCYICYVLDSVKPGENLPDGSRVSRFTVKGQPPRVDPASEKVLLTFLAGGHNGGDLHFGPDGYLYISTGDATSPNPPDALDTGQDCSDLLSSILRIDVDRQDPGLAYAVPKDNPFVGMKNVRSEIWAYGFRNPWRMSFDRSNGDLWVGDVGWELWEMVYRIKKGGNYGWSVMEGRQPVKAEGKRGPTPILPPTLEFPHTEAASITGGYVYRGTRLPDLVGSYICGDWVTRKLWATRFEGDRIVTHKEIAQGSQRIVAFGESKEGEIFLVNYDDPGGTLHRLVPNPALREKATPFPRKLSETGLFSSAKDHTTAPGVMPFSINAVQWADHASAERFLALPGESSVTIYDSAVAIPGGFFSGDVFFPSGGVLAKTISMEMERGRPTSRRRLETQILHFDGNTWRGYTYAWNDAQTDAELVPSGGGEARFTVADRQAPGGKRVHTWRYPSRTECLTCHNPWAGNTLAFTHPQLDRTVNYGGTMHHQLAALRQMGLVDLKPHPDRPDSHFNAPRRLTDPHDSSALLEDRARSYLHVNCAHCHRFGGGGTADLELRHGPPLDQTKTLETRPVQGTFEIAGAQILAPGDPFRSVLYYRIAKLGRGRMPHIGSEVVDERGLRLIHDWIRALPVRRDDRQLLQHLRELDETAIAAKDKVTWSARLEKAARDLAKARKREKPDAADRREAEVRLRQEDLRQAEAREKDRSQTIARLLASTGSALLLARDLGENRIPASMRGSILTASLKAEPQVRDLFERFLPDELRVKRLGSVVVPEQILSRKGDVARGRDLVLKSATLQCLSCHKVQGTGASVGPELSQVGKKLSRAQLLESLLEPSKTIEPPYVAYILETTDGKFHTGLLVSRDEREVVLRGVGDKEVRIPVNKVERLSPQSKSLMPELLLRDLTAEQAADLLEYLSTLR